jgi:nucleotidyltransferase substrate binding protein (TIGR01987 family)
MLRSNIKFKKIQKALIAPELIYLKPVQDDRSNIDATIQRFEFTFELAWKFLKDYFLKRDIELYYPKEVFNVNLIDNEEIWIKMLQDRNMTSYTYDEKLADTI